MWKVSRKSLIGEDILDIFCNYPLEVASFIKIFALMTF